MKFNNFQSNFLDNSKKTKKIIMSTILLITICCIIVTRTVSNRNDNTITYSGVENIIKSEDTAIIYYYNSASSNSNNKKIKSYLNKNKIRYYLYNDKNVDKKEYNKLLKLLEIDKKLFGCPSIIYIRNGEMYGNLININDIDVVEKFIEIYDLHIVK